MKIAKWITFTAAAAIGFVTFWDREPMKVKGHHHSIEVVVTRSIIHTNKNGDVWYELKFDQKPDRTTPIYE